MAERRGPHEGVTRHNQGRVAEEAGGLVLNVATLPRQLATASEGVGDLTKSDDGDACYHVCGAGSLENESQADLPIASLSVETEVPPEPPALAA